MGSNHLYMKYICNFLPSELYSQESCLQILTVLNFNFLPFF